VPPVYETKPLEDVMRSTAGSTRMMLVEPGARADVAHLTAFEGPRPSSVVVFTGPEGGWDAQEIDAASAAGMKLLSFGSRVLRADAAAAVVIPVLRYIWRDL
jgi:16S rRNA (uracil1498-N3)-methyltransferase